MPSTRGRGELVGVACEKPLARNLARGAAHGRADRIDAAAARLSREPGLRAGHRARQGDRLAAGGADRRAAVSRARGGGAQRAAHAVVLGRRAAGRRRAQRHALPQLRGRAPPADGARREARATLRVDERERADRVAEVERGRSTPKCCSERSRRRRRLRARAGRGLRARFDRADGAGRRAAADRSDDIVELRRTGAAAAHRTAGPRVRDADRQPDDGPQRLPRPARSAARRARTSSRSRTPSRA